MANYRGLRLMKGESWSRDFPGCIDKGNGVFRKPKERLNKDGRLVYHSSYFIVANCCVCAKKILKDRNQLHKSLRAVCGKQCFDAIKIKPDGSKKFKRGAEGGHIMVKQRAHPYANKMKDVAEHRLVMESHIGRYLTPQERVHHINLKKDDNNLNNLVLFSSDSEHFKSHGSLNACVATLIEQGVLQFNRSKNIYEVA